MRLDSICPYLSNIKCEKKIRERQKSMLIIDGFDEKTKNEYRDVVKQPDIKKLKVMYEEVFVAKGKLEDKAKSMTLAITVSVTLILGLIDKMLMIFSTINFMPVRGLIACMSIVAIWYMIIAGLASAKVFLTDIMIYKIDDTEDKLRQQYRKNIILNRLSNVVRSNYIYTAYECLRNSLILLFGLFVFMIIVA